MLGAQIQGAINFGISNALFSKITLKDGRGEEGTPTVTAALVEAVHAAGGPRIRRLPIMDNELGFRRA